MIKGVARRLSDRLVLVVVGVSVAAVFTLLFLDAFVEDLPVSDGLVVLGRAAAPMMFSAAVLAYLARALNGDVDGIVRALGKIRVVERQMGAVMSRVVGRLGQVDAMAEEVGSLRKELRSQHTELAMQGQANRAWSEEAIDRLNATLAQVVDRLDKLTTTVVNRDAELEDRVQEAAKAGYTKGFLEGMGYQPPVGPPKEPTLRGLPRAVP